MRIAQALFAPADAGARHEPQHAPHTREGRRRQHRVRALTVLVGLSIALLAARARAEDASGTTQTRDWRSIQAYASTELKKDLALRDERTLITLTYSVAFAAGDLHDFSDKPSPRGFDYSVLVPLLRGWHIGAAVGYNRFYQEFSRRTIALENADVNAKLYRSFSCVTLSLVNRYYFLEPERLARPYLGLRTGVAFASATTQVADFTLQDSPAGFMLAPEAGLALRLSNSLDAVAGYQYTFTTASFRSTDRASFHALQMGLQLRY